MPASERIAPMMSRNSPMLTIWLSISAKRMATAAAPLARDRPRQRAQRRGQAFLQRIVERRRPVIEGQHLGAMLGQLPGEPGAKGIDPVERHIVERSLRRSQEQ